MTASTSGLVLFCKHLVNITDCTHVDIETDYVHVIIGIYNNSHYSL